jgi:hypothetical protein
MMLTKRETVLIIILMTLLTVLGYYVLYLAPALERIAITSDLLIEKENEVAAAQLRELQYVQLELKRAELIPDLERYTQEIPLSFDDADILYRLQDIFYDFTKEINISFSENTALSNETAVHTVVLQFSVTQDDLIKILQRFSDENIYNRIVNYSLARADGFGSQGPLQRVVMHVDYLTMQ